MTTRYSLPPLPGWIARQLPSDIDRYAVDVDGLRMAVMEIGSGKPILMVHGNPTWGFLYRKVVAELTGESLRIILPDLIGLGFSDKPRDAEQHKLIHHANWLATLIDTLELRRVGLVGQDWGGPIGVLGIDHSRAELDGLVVLNTVLSPPKPGFKPTLFHRFARMPLISDLAFRGLGFPQTVLAPAQGDKRSITGAVAKAYRYPLRRFGDRMAPLALARMVPDSPQHISIEHLHRCQEVIEAYRGPAAIVWGDRDPILGSVRNWIQTLLPQASMRRTKAGHFLQEEVPGEIADAVREVMSVSSASASAG
jgi:haloalkane dehalogenase